MDRPVTVKVHEKLQGVEDRTCLVLDDDGPFCQRLARALTQRGFLVSAVSSVSEARDIARLNATAVAAVKAGAVDSLSKPADVEDIIKSLLARADAKPAPPENPMSADRVRWEHIQRVYELCDQNVSETARRLNMHRRTLQRILAKRAPR